MVVEEEIISNHLEESMAAETTTEINECLFQNTTSTDKDSDKDLTNLIPESNTREEEDSFVSVSKSEDSEALVMAAAEGKKEDEKVEEMLVHCRNSESAAALSGVIENSVAVESTNVVEDLKDRDDDAVKEIDVPNDEVSAVECGGSELPCTVNVDGDGDGEISVTEKDENECDDKETVNKDEGGEFLKDREADAVTDQFKNEGDIDVQLKDVENVQEMVASDVQMENTNNIQRDETITEELVVAEAVKEEGMLADEEETLMANEETMDAVAGNDEETLVECESKSLDTEAETENSLDTEGEMEKSVDIEMETEKSLDTKAERDKSLSIEREPERSLVTAETEKSVDIGMETEKSLDTEAEMEKSLDIEREPEGSLGTVVETEKSVDIGMETEKSLDTEADTQKSLDIEREPERFLDIGMETEKSVDIGMETDKSLDTEAGTEKSLDTEAEMEKSLDMERETKRSLDAETETEKSLDTEMETEEEANVADEEKIQETEMETETELPESSTKDSGGKRKRGKISKTTPKSSAAPRKTIEEDVCFICFDGGDLVLCDRRNCPKAYHPSCVNRDEAFFQSKGRWNCGWHLCSICERKAEYMCYTCTYSLCKACTKTSVILCVREKEKKGLCEACMKTVMLIENNENQDYVNFDDKNSWEHLFKDYWIETKAKHNLSLDELAQAKNPWKGSGKQESPIAQSDVKDDDGSGPDNSSETLKPRKSRRNTKKQKTVTKEDDSSMEPVPENPEWASKELLELVTHMRNGDASVISQFEVQDLLLEYIKRNKLRDPNRKSQIICDSRLENLFGKPRVAHIEMLKLLESHFLVKEDSHIDDFQGSVVDTEAGQIDEKDKKRRGRKKGDRRGPQSNREDYAAIDIHNINLIYLRRKLVEDLLDDMETFHGKIVGTFVRIRISGANQKQDIYRLVQVTGTSEAAQYTLGKRTTFTMLEILNLDKTEIISIDSISNQEFTEDECKRLRQSIKCGLIRRLTVGDILDKAMDLQAARVNDWLETEVMRLSHLRDRASDLGRKKELRECVEKLSILKTPEERARRLEEFPLIHDDPTMDPEYGSEDDTDLNDNKEELYKRSDSFKFNKRGKDPFSPRGDYSSKESWSGTPRSFSGKHNEFTESWSGTPRSSSGKSYEVAKNLSNRSFEVHTENSWREQEPFVQQPVILEKPSIVLPRETTVAAEPAPKVNETEKMWHYKDPSEKIQGPFSMVQLRKWSKNGYFPVGLKIWRKSDKEDDGILLTDALEGKFNVVDRKVAGQDGPNLTRDFANLPSPTPNKGTSGWTEGQAGPHTGQSSYPSGNEGLPSQSPTQNNIHLVACANKDANLAGSAGVSTVPVAVAPQNADQVSQNSVQSSQLGQQVVPPPDSNFPPQMVQSVSGQNPQGWTQNFQPNPGMNMAGLQPLGFNQWNGVPNMVQNPVGNFMPTVQEPWGQFPFPVNQPNMQQQQQQQQPPPQPPQQNVSWATMGANPNMGWAGPNTGNGMNWGPMVQSPQVTGTVDPTWVMQSGWVPQPPVQGVMPNQNWVPAPIQGPIVAGNGNPSWVGPVPPGNNQVVAPNAGWVAPVVTQGPANMNTGWVGGPANQGVPTPNPGWVPPSGNPTAAPPPPPTGNTNQNWGSRNHGGNWGGNRNRGSFSGQRRNRGGSSFRGERRNFNNRQESYHKDDKHFHGSGSRDSARSPEQ